MKDFRSTIIKVVIVIIFAGVIVNDLAAVVSTYYLADEVAKKVAFGTATAYKVAGKQESVAVEAAYKLAEQNNGRLIGFDLKNSEVIVQISLQADRVLVASYLPPLRHYLNGSAIASASLD